MHPLVRIISLISFGVALQLMHWQTFLVIGLLLFPAMVWRGSGVFITLVRRARWLLISIILIYAYATPGEYLPGLPDVIAPTYEGLNSGLLQAGRLASMLAALSILLATTNRDEFINGLYQLLFPLRRLGIAPEHFSVRLWLTLHYVERMPPETLHKLKRNGWSLETLQQGNEGPGRVQLEHRQLMKSDLLLLLALPIVIWVVA